MENNYIPYIFSLVVLLLFAVQSRNTFRFRKERDDLAADHKLKEAQLNSIESQIKEKDSHIKNIEDLLYKSNAKSDSLQGDVLRLTDELDRSINDFENLSTKLNEVEASFVEVRQKYLPIANDIDEAVVVVKGVKELENKLALLQAERARLANEYDSGYGKYQQLINEIAVLEERLELYSYGLYEPHYSFDSSDKYREELDKCYQERKRLVKDNLAASCSTTWTVSGSKAEGTRMTKNYIKIMVRAFNGECDSALLKVRWNNAKSMEERILKSFEAINKLGENHEIKLSEDYLKMRVKELWLTHEYHEKIHEEREEQRRIREQIREEERSMRELEAAREEAEKEEARYSKALEIAKQNLEGRHGEEKRELETKIAQLEISLQKAIDLKNRAISMAQITKAGYVYVISNIGSFGDDVFKIGMTRRLEPTDRVRELSGASVPFSFDVHAMIYSENAPELENYFHKKFKFNRLNLVNGRKEFFKVSLGDIAQAAADLNHDVHFTKLAEARDFRETLAIKEKITKETSGVEAGVFNTDFPSKIFDELEVQNSNDEDEVSASIIVES